MPTPQRVGTPAREGSCKHPEGETCVRLADVARLQAPRRMHDGAGGGWQTSATYRRSEIIERGGAGNVAGEIRSEIRQQTLTPKRFCTGCWLCRGADTLVRAADTAARAPPESLDAG